MPFAGRCSVTEDTSQARLISIALDIFLSLSVLFGAFDHGGPKVMKGIIFHDLMGFDCYRGVLS